MATAGRVCAIFSKRRTAKGIASEKQNGIHAGHLQTGLSSGNLSKRRATHDLEKISVCDSGGKVFLPLCRPRDHSHAKFPHGEMGHLWQIKPLFRHAQTRHEVRRNALISKPTKAAPTKRGLFLCPFPTRPCPFSACPQAWPCVRLGRHAEGRKLARVSSRAFP